jgi:hypothetical protein
MIHDHTPHMSGLYPVSTERRQQKWHRHLRKQPCIYCGSTGGHPDHVPPKSIFYGKVDDLITVPAAKVVPMTHPTWMPTSRSWSQHRF